MRDHRKLRVFALADELALQVYKVSKRFPAAERFGLTNQLRRAAVSVAANIVEGATRPSEVEYGRFLTVAYGSAQELEYELSLAARLGYLGFADSAQILNLASQTSRALYALNQTIAASAARNSG